MPQPVLPTRPHLQNLPPGQAHFCLGVERFLLRETDFAPHGKTILTAFSGGLDSTALLLLLCALENRLNITIHAAHLDHGLRPESADEARRAKTFCAALAVPFHTARIDAAALAKAEGQGLEAASRRARYAFLEEVRRQTNAHAMATAHQLNDLAEDALMRLLRGAGWPNLGGMPAHDPGRRLIRPLLLTPRAELETFAQACGASWIEDASNTDPAFLRNRVRRAVLPLFLEENPNFLQTVARLWKQARLDDAFFRDLLDDLAPSAPLLPRDLLLQTSPSLRLRLYKRELDRLGPGESLTATLFELDDAVASKRRALFQFPGFKQAETSSKGVLFSLSKP